MHLATETQCQGVSPHQAAGAFVFCRVRRIRPHLHLLQEEDDSVLQGIAVFWTFIGACRVTVLYSLHYSLCMYVDACRFVLQRVAACFICSVLQRVAVFCSVQRYRGIEVSSHEVPLMKPWRRLA